MTNKEKYRQLCQNEPDICLFAKDWWLDAVAGNNWDVVLEEKDKKIIAAMPFHYLKKWCINIVTVPNFTRYHGLWIKYPDNQKYVSRLSFEQKAISSLIAQLPSFGSFTTSLHYNYTNWKPFHFAGFKQTSYYDYVASYPFTPEQIWDQMDDGLRGNLRKTEKLLSLEITNDTGDLIRLFNSTKAHNDFSIQNSSELIQNITRACTKHQCCQILNAKYNNQIIASVLIVWDSHSLYTLISGAEAQHRKLSGLSFLYWHAIKIASEKKLSFDFMGTMLKQVDPHLRDFGLQQTPYSIITKDNNWVFKIKKLLK